MNEAGGTRVNDGIETTRDRALKWIEKYATENFGILIQCEICSKWRISYQYADKKEVPNKWQCSMLVCANEVKGKCTDTEETFEDLLNIMYYPGSLVWAKYANYPWWPGMIDLDPDYIRFFEPYDNNTLIYHVTFFDKPPTRNWITETLIRPFSPEAPEKNKERKFEPDLSRALRRAHAAEKLPIKERLKKYSFAINYKGPWPIAINSDDDELDEKTQETNATNSPSIVAGNNSTYDIINEKNVNKSAAVEGTATVPKKSVKDITKKERVSPTREKAKSGFKHRSNKKPKKHSTEKERKGSIDPKETLNLSNIVMLHKEFSQLAQNIDNNIAGEGTSSDKIVRRITTVEGTTRCSLNQQKMLPETKEYFQPTQKRKQTPFPTIKLKRNKGKKLLKEEEILPECQRKPSLVLLPFPLVTVFGENTAEESCKIINKVKATVEKTTGPPCKKAKTIIEEKITFHSSTKEKTSSESKHVMDKERGKMISTKERKHLKDTEEHQKKSSFVMSHNEPSSFIDDSASRKGTLSCKKIKEVSLGAVEETATVQRKLAEKIVKKEGISPTGQKDKRNSRFKHRINDKELGENIKNKKRKLSNSKERFKLSNFVLSRKKRCPRISECDNNTSRGRNVMKEVTTVPRKLANNVTEKERTIPNGIKDRNNSGNKLRIYKERGENITKKERKFPSGSKETLKSSFQKLPKEPSHLTANYGNIITREGTSSDKISKGENSAAVEKTTTVPRKPAKDVTEKENTFPITTKDITNAGSKHRFDKKQKENITRKEKFANGTKYRLKKSNVLKTPKEPSPLTANHEKNKDVVQMQERDYANLPSISADKITVGEKITSHKRIEKVNSSDAEGTTTVPRKSTEIFAEKERTFPTFTKEKTNSGFKPGVENEAGKKITKELKPKKDTKEHQEKSSFLVSKEQPSLVAGKNSVQEGKSPLRLIFKRKKSASVEETTSIPKKPGENLTEKEITISRGTKEKTSSRSKHGIETKEGKKISKKHKYKEVKKDSKEHQNKSSFGVSHEHPFPVAPNFDNNTVGEGISSDKITKEVNFTVEGMTTVQRKPTESLTEKERTFPTGTKEEANSSFKHRVGKEDGENIIIKFEYKKGAQVKSNERTKESCFGVTHEERNPVPANIGNNTDGEGISHNKISREVNLTSVDGMTTIQRLPQERFSEKETSFPVDTEKANSGLKHRVQNKEIKKKSKEHKVKKDSKELPINSFVVSHEQPSPVADTIEQDERIEIQDMCDKMTNVSFAKDINTAGEGISHNNISREVNLTSVDGTTTIQRLPQESFSKKERTIPVGVEKVNSGLKHRVQKKEIKKNSKGHKVKKDSKELPINSFVVSHEQPSPVADTIEKDERIEVQDICDKMTNVSFAKDNCTLDPNVNKEVSLTVAEQDTSCCMIIKEVNATVEETASPCKIEKERKTHVEEETSIPVPDPKNTIEKERNLPNVSNELPKESDFVVSREEPYIFIPYTDNFSSGEETPSCHINKEVNMLVVEDMTPEQVPSKEAEPLAASTERSNELLKECSFGMPHLEQHPIIPNLEIKREDMEETNGRSLHSSTVNSTSEEGPTSCQINMEVNLAAVEEATSTPGEDANNRVEKETHFPRASIERSNELLEESSCVMPHLETNSAIPNISKYEIKEEVDLEETEDTSIHSSPAGNCTSVEKTASCKIKMEVDLAAVEGMTLIPMQSPENTIEDGNVPSASNVSGISEDVGIEDERREITDTTLHSFAPDNCTSGETSSVNINKGVNIAAVKETTSIPMPAPKNIIEKGKYLPSDSNENQEKSSFVISRPEPSSVSDNFGDEPEAEKREINDICLLSSAEGCFVFNGLFY
ncbi:zinc finger CW-type PWWP domain protein 1 [Trichonephila inaurata madagascariensis]|uniref:Zinc finger CW-type PWWP domain protein 1 n=1 Tax=Trichonephila inaurata madagascariensis TaxID=2747483 RepID=A0A8X6YBQ8_9ARAC|nr:zinc finger CW-type PWWP domain protein 1 [Trichonephila inaurata madagascariensis]